MGKSVSITNQNQQLLYVEGQTDKLVIEAFLSIGEQEGYWENWRNRVVVEISEGSKNVVKKIADRNSWGLIDRDEKAIQEVKELQTKHANLLILPRWTIENYFIQPQELSSIQLPPYKTRHNFAQIEKYVADGIQHGALWHVLYERDAFQFCRGHEDGYPMAILGNIIFEEKIIHERFAHWQNHLNPKDVVSLYQKKLREFEQEKSDHYTKHIHGKLFFSQVIVQKILNPIEQQSDDVWLNLLIEGITTCPADLVPILRRVVG
jgi:hypothetical protein